METPALESLFDEVAGLKNIAKFLRTAFFTEHFWWLLLKNKQ